MSEVRFPEEFRVDQTKLSGNIFFCRTLIGA